MALVTPPATVTTGLDRELEQHRRRLTGYCYRMLGTPHEAEDAVQETFLRAWRARDAFEGRAALGSWLYRIATNVCFDMLRAGSKRARPMDLGPAREPVASNLHVPGEVTWLQPIADATVLEDGDPADVVAGRETLRLAFVAALQRLPPRQRAALILCEVLHWRAQEAAELLETSLASVNSALQRARATLGDAQATGGLDGAEVPQVSAAALGAPERELLERYVTAFEAYDMDALTALIREDAIQSMPPYDLWLRGREDIFRWWLGPGIGCRGSRLLPAPDHNGTVAFAQYKPSESGSGYDPWALMAVGLHPDGGIGELIFFLEPERLFARLGLPARLDG